MQSLEKLPIPFIFKQSKTLEKFVTDSVVDVQGLQIVEVDCAQSMHYPKADRSQFKWLLVLKVNFIGWLGVPTCTSVQQHSQTQLSLTLAIFSSSMTPQLPSILIASLQDSANKMIIQSCPTNYLNLLGMYNYDFCQTMQFYKSLYYILQQKIVVQIRKQSESQGQYEKSASSQQQNNEVTYEHLPPATIIAWRYSSKKKTLNLDGCEGFYMPVLRDRDWSSVETLWLRKCGITDSAIEDIFSPAMNWSNVKSLRLNQNSITAKTLLYLIDQSSINTSALKYLGLGSINLGSHGIKVLTKMNLAALETLNLSYVEINQEGLKHFTKSNSRKLTCLSISGHNNIGQRGYMAMGLGNWRNLIRIEMWTNDYGLPVKIMNIILLPHSKSINMNYSIYSHKFGSSVSKMLKSKFHEPVQGQPHYYY